MNAGDDRTKWLRIYVSDHLAGAAAGSSRARRLADAERDGPDAAALQQLADEIAADRRALQVLADSLNLRPQRSKQLVAAIAERVGLVKLNGRIFRRSPLTTLVEVEAMVIAVRGKLAGWETLRGVPEAAAVNVVDIEDLVTRTTQQYDTLQQIHRRTAERLLGRPGPIPP